MTSKIHILTFFWYKNDKKMTDKVVCGWRIFFKTNIWN